MMHWFDVSVFDISLTDMMSIYCVFGFVAVVDDDDDVCACVMSFLHSNIRTPTTNNY